MNSFEQITLKDGRKLAFAVYGAKQGGQPIFYFHGWPSSRLEGSNYVDALMGVNGRLIAVDRPGIGQSDIQPKRTLLDWPDDVCELADQLGFAKFHVLGTSGGGPYVAACAYKIPDRLLGASIIAGLSPMNNPKTKDGMRLMNRIILPMGKSAPWLLGLILKMMRSSFENPKSLERMLSDLPDVDKALFKGELATHFLTTGQESFTQGVQGNIVEGRIYAEPWGFNLRDIKIPVSIWQGSLDVNVPLSNGRILADEIPNANAHFIEEEGHLSLIINQKEAILIDLLQFA
ncbi:MAG: alpha/beta hydrolase [Chloroflexota bacterium]